MNLLLLLESIKFHRVRQDGAVRRLFVFCYLVNIVSYFIPGSDPNLTGLILFLQGLQQNRYVAPTFTRGNYVFLGLSAAAAALTLLCVYFYAAIYAGEREGKTVGDAVRGLVRALPSLLLCAFLMIIPAVLSIFTLFVPLILIATTFYFLPLNLILGRMRLTDALAASFRDTRHMKFVIFLQFVTLMLVLNLPENLVFGIFGLGGIPGTLVSGFFVAARALARGRLMALLYLNLVKKVPIVITSKPTV